MFGDVPDISKAFSVSLWSARMLTGTASVCFVVWKIIISYCEGGYGQVERSESLKEKEWKPVGKDEVQFQLEVCY